MLARGLSALVSAAFVLTAATASAETWPSRSVRLVVPFAAGGAADVVTRIVGARVGASLGQTFIVENRTGASGNIGTESAARSEPDGYTFLVGSPGTLAINPHMFPKLPYSTADFEMVSHVATFPQILVASSRLNQPTLAGFVAHARAAPQVLNYGSSGNASTGHLVTAMFLNQAGVQAVHVPFRGGGPAAQALLAGTVDFVIDGLPTFLGLIGSGSVRVLAISSRSRWPDLPDVPAIGEAVVPGFDLSSWVIFAAPKGTPKEIVDRFAGEVRTAITDEDVRRRLIDVGALPVGSTPAEALAFQRLESAKWKRVVEVSGAKVE